MTNDNMSRERYADGMSRREFLKWMNNAAKVIPYAWAGFSLLDSLGCGCESEVSTEKAYGKAYFETAKKDVKEIKKLNRLIDWNPDSVYAEKARERLEKWYIDPILQEFPKLQKEGIIRGNSIRLGDYTINVLDYEGPVFIEKGYSDIIVKIELYKNGKKLDLNSWPFIESKRINLKTHNWSVEKILNRFVKD